MTATEPVFNNFHEQGFDIRTDTMVECTDLPFFDASRYLFLQQYKTPLDFDIRCEDLEVREYYVL